jgi:hypothetical protein
MTDAEWMTSTDPQTMLESVRGEVSERKLRLFAVACCRLVWHLLVDERSRKAVEVAERFADGGATQQEIEAARSDAWQFTLYEVWEEEAPDLGADALNAADAPPEPPNGRRKPFGRSSRFSEVSGSQGPRPRRTCSAASSGIHSGSSPSMLPPLVWHGSSPRLPTTSGVSRTALWTSAA